MAYDQLFGQIAVFYEGQLRLTAFLDPELQDGQTGSHEHGTGNRGKTLS